MIKDTVTKKRSRPALTSDHWHVVHTKWCAGNSPRPFSQLIVSEHDTRDAAEARASELLDSMAEKMEDRPPRQRDRITVRPPRFRSLKEAGKRRIP